ncbi:hypothetical protein [Rubrobacter calidifluminis]|uniref:hypothetical protein n=1 Tax=Rubrobacter calidifluminis TaxID=1392640 RepID=UPI0023622DE3|nr:hypothetical protein [Rubrobacter calidifluminis]
MKALAGLAVLALVQPWSPARLRRPLLVFTWVAGALLALYGGANLLVRGLMAASVIGTPPSMHSPAAF